MKIQPKRQKILASFACLLTFSVLLVTACQKQDNSKFKDSTSLIENAREFFANEIVKKEKELLDSSTSGTPKIGRMKKLGRLLNWDQAKEYSQDGVQYVIAPVDQQLKPFKNQNFEAVRALIFYKDESDRMHMNIVEILSKKGMTLGATAQQIVQMAFLNKYLGRTSSIKSANGSILFYNEHYQPEESFQLANGVWSRAKITLQSKKRALARQAAGTMSRLGTEMENCETTYLVAFWYDTYTGEVVDYVILDQWDECSTSAPSPEGYESYGGGANFVPEEDCSSLALEMKGSPVAEKQSVYQISYDPLIRTKTYHWVIYKQSWGIWKFTSHEKGVHRRQLRDIVHPWKWESLTHESISKEGVWAGGTSECKLNTWESHVALYTAGIELNYTITDSAICPGFPISSSNTYTSSSIWHVDE